MKNIVLSRRLAFLALAASQACTAFGQTAATEAQNAQQEIKTLQGQVIQAILKADTGVLEKLYAGDYVAIHGDGKLTTKTEEIENLKTGITKYESITVHEGKIRIYGDTAVVNALASVKTVVNGRPYSGQVRNTRVWVKEAGTWKIVVFQATRVEP